MSSKRVFIASLVAVALASLLVSAMLIQRQRALRLPWIERLSAVDAVIAQGDKGKAAKALRRLRANATGTGEWISIVKRERSLDLQEQSIDTLRAGLKKLPASESLTALLSYTLYESRRSDWLVEASSMAEGLLSSHFSATASLVCITADAYRRDRTLERPEAQEGAYQATGIPLFLRNAASLYAFRGDMEEARRCALSIPDPTDTDAYCTALIMSDSSLDESVLSLLASSETLRSLLIRADAAWRLSDLPRASSLWERIVELYPDRSSLAWHNAAVIEGLSTDGIRYLTGCVDRFPRYFPAVARFARLSLLVEDKAPDVDPVGLYLIERDFLSDELRSLLIPPRLELAKARTLLDMAVIGNEPSADARFFVERERFISILDGDQTRSRGSIWKLLERFPHDPFAYSYSIWYFLSIKDYSTAFALNNARAEGPLPLYMAIEYSLSGDLEKACEGYESGANDGESSWVSLANLAVCHDKLGDSVRAAGELIRAASLTLDARRQSDLYLRSATIMLRSRMGREAQDALRQALELNPANHRARALLAEVEKAR